MRGQHVIKIDGGSRSEPSENAEYLRISFHICLHSGVKHRHRQSTAEASGFLSVRSARPFGARKTVGGTAERGSEFLRKRLRKASIISASALRRAVFRMPCKPPRCFRQEDHAAKLLQAPEKGIRITAVLTGIFRHASGMFTYPLFYHAEDKEYTINCE